MTVISLLFNCLYIAIYKSQQIRNRKHSCSFFEVKWDFLLGKMKVNQNYTDLNCLLIIKVLIKIREQGP